MSFAMPIVLGAIFLLFIIVGVVYYIDLNSGKSYLAVSAVAGMGAIWVGYVSLLSINWPMVILAALTKSDGPAILKAAQPEFWTILTGIPLAGFISFLLYRIALQQIHADKF